jgi:hypothetical protein
MRHVLIHYHVFKNAGTTLERMLHRSFGKEGWSQYEPGDDFQRTEEDLHPVVTHLAENPNLKALSSHRLKYPTIRDPQIAFHDLIFLRDPIDRLVSIYRYLQLVPTSAGDLADLPLDGGLRDFIEALVSRRPWYINDQQTGFLAHRGEIGHLINSRDLELAKRTISDASAPGVVDLFYESTRAAEWLLRPYFSNLCLATFERLNPSSVEANWSEQTRRELRDACGLRLFREVLQLVRNDLELVAFARQEIIRRFLAMPVSTSPARFHQPDWSSHFQTTCRRYLVPEFVGRPVRMLEIGVFEGRAMAWAFENFLQHPQSSYLGCDVWNWPGFTTDQETWQQVESSAKLNAIAVGDGRAILIKGSVRDAVATDDGSFDFVYVDGDHTEESCLNDSLTAFDVLRPGGYILWDDVGTEADRPWPGVQAGLDRFWSRFGGRLDVIHRGYQLLARKREEP